MRGGIDIKSFLIGGFMVLSLMYSFGAVSQPAPATTTGGRFAMARNAGQTFVLDTATGRLWSLCPAGPSGRDMVLVDVPYAVVDPLTSEVRTAAPSHSSFGSMSWTTR